MPIDGGGEGNSPPRRQGRQVSGNGGRSLLGEPGGSTFRKPKRPSVTGRPSRKLERAMRFELTTSTLARWRSTTELRPRCETRGGFLHGRMGRASENLHENGGSRIRVSTPGKKPTADERDGRRSTRETNRFRKPNAGIGQRWALCPLNLCPSGSFGSSSGVQMFAHFAALGCGWKSPRRPMPFGELLRFGQGSRPSGEKLTL